MQHLLRFSMLGCFILALSGCDDGGSDAGTGGAGGAPGPGPGGGAGGAPSPGGGAPTFGGGPGTGTEGKQVTWDMSGWIQGDTNEFGIQGPWYAYDDCMDAPPLPCTTRDASMTGPDMKGGWSVVGTGGEGKVCAKGEAAKVMDMMYAKQWGFGLAFDLSSSGGAVAVKSPFDAASKSIIGFSFDLSGTAPTTIRINLPIRDPDTATYFREVAILPTPTTYKVLFNDMANFHQGSWIAMQQPADVRPFEPNHIFAAQFQVFTNIMAATPFDFCVTNFRVLTQ